MEEKENKNIYAIPANYTDSGKLFGGMVETRNAVETGILLFCIGYPELMWIPMPGTIRIVAMVVTLLPLSVLSVVGIDGDSMFQFVGHMILFWFRRRKLHMRGVGYCNDTPQGQKTGRKKTKRK